MACKVCDRSFYHLSLSQRSWALLFPKEALLDFNELDLITNGGATKSSTCSKLQLKDQVLNRDVEFKGIGKTLMVPTMTKMWPYLQ